MSRQQFIDAYTALLIERYANDEVYMTHLRAVPWVRNGGEAAQPTPYLLKRLAMRMVDGILGGSASKDSDTVKAACRALGIKHTYKAIQEFCRD